MPATVQDPTIPSQAHVQSVALGFVWDVATLNWVRATQAGGGGGGGAVTVADGADVALGATTDAEATGDGSSVGILKRLRTLLAGGLPSALASDRLKVDGSGVTQPVSGTFWQATQPVSIGASVAVTGPLTDGQLRATPVPVSGTVTASGPLTDAQLRAVAVPVSGTVTVGSVVSTKGDLTPAAPAAATVGVASAQAVAANASRKGLVLVNVSNNRISFGLGATAVLDSGITLYPGGVWEMDEYTFDVGAVNAIASAASSPLAIQEWA